jgi:muramoyltetrapeptide carboxypeptidase
MLAKRLKSGDVIGIVSPAYAVAAGQYDGAIAALKALGYAVKTGAHLYGNDYGYAATERERADDFNAMIADETVSMVLFGGGYVSNEILPLVDFSMIAKNPKIIASYSDGTTLLNAITSRTALVTYYGQRPGTFAELTDYNRRCFIENFVETETPAFAKNGEWETLVPGRAEGTLTGGYVENFALMLSGGYLRYGAGEPLVLFLEDHERFSSPARVSMYLSHIEQSGIIGAVKGLLFGHYSDAENAELTARLERFGTRHGIPVVTCNDFGHGASNGILQIGRRAALDAEGQTLRYAQGRA